MKRPLLVILGPTAVGKSDLALKIALSCGGEIVNADSMQVYRGLDIGTGKVPPAERKGIEHHLIDIAEPGVDFSAGEFGRRASEAVSGILERGKLPIVVGGTGLYIKSLLRGLAPLPERNEEMRTRLRRIAERKGPTFLYRLLKRIDPAYAALVQEKDEQRLVRALEVYFMTGEKLSDSHKSHRFEGSRFNAYKIGLTMPRGLLYERINERVRRMFQAGWVDEVKKLLENRVPESSNAFKAIGYRQILEYLRGNIGLEETIEEVAKGTRRYAKRQFTWFMKEESVLWYDVSGTTGDDPSVRILEDLRRWLLKEGLSRGRGEMVTPEGNREDSPTGGENDGKK